MVILAVIHGLRFLPENSRFQVGCCKTPVESSRRALLRKQTKGHRLEFPKKQANVTPPDEPVNSPDGCMRNTGGKKCLDVGLGNDLFGYDTKSMNSEKENKRAGLCQTEKLLHSKGNHGQNEEAA